MAVSADIIGKEICEALGISIEGVYHIGLDFTVGKVASVRIGRYLNKEDGGRYKHYTHPV